MKSNAIFKDVPGIQDDVDVDTFDVNNVSQSQRTSSYRDSVERTWLSFQAASPREISSGQPVRQNREFTFSPSLDDEVDDLTSDNPKSLDLTRRKVRLLALHGARSNKEVTALQLNNLGISEQHFDIVHVEGNIPAEPDVSIATFTARPCYSWLDDDDDSSLLRAVASVIEAIDKNGPFDAIYGFSQGAVIATFVMQLASDETLRDRLADFMGIQAGNAIRTSLTSLRKSIFDASKPAISTNKRRKSSLDTSKPAISTNKNVDDVENATEFPTFAFAILVCADLSTDQIEEHFSDEIETKLTTHSLHIIGIDDPAKTFSETVALRFSNNLATRSVLYMPSGHNVPRTMRTNRSIRAKISIFFAQVQHNTGSVIPEFQWNDISAVSKLAVHEDVQVAIVRTMMPQTFQSATVQALLKSAPPSAPLLRTAGDVEGNVTTYGQMLAFLSAGGVGDLRRVGVQPGEVVVYVVDGASALGAVSLLAVGAQTAAAPLIASTSQSDALAALKQFEAKHVIFFDGMSAKGIEAAVEEFNQNGRHVGVHRATMLGNSQPGLFTLESSPSYAEIEDASHALCNLESDTFLLLRTSGTTSAPKGVPLKHGQVVRNGMILASTIGLNSQDICCSAMPLHHIGGISASVLCSIAVGASLNCIHKFNPLTFVETLSTEPKPTWYSAVPTIHNAVVAHLIDNAKDYAVVDGVWSGHNLRMIRSGAAALLANDADALDKMFGVPLYMTYSMSEQMPISQPPFGMQDQRIVKPGTVGVPVATSMALVGADLTALPRGTPGQVAISGKNALGSYLRNAEADRKNFFILSTPLPQFEQAVEMTERFFLTGDMGTMDEDGFIKITGRMKEIIKRGGEQVSPYEVEEVLVTHDWVRLSIVFPVQSTIFGEEVGAAIVLSPTAPSDLSLEELIRTLKSHAVVNGLVGSKHPSVWQIVQDADLPKTKSNKYKRGDTAEALGLTRIVTVKPAPTRPKVDFRVLDGFRFYLSAMVMFMHFGTDDSWGRVAKLRNFPWHVHLFFTLAGFTLAIVMPPPPQKALTYWSARLKLLYPVYLFALGLALLNLLLVCRPSTMGEEFHWSPLPGDANRTDLFCEPTPAISSYWGSLIGTVVVHVFALIATPLWPVSWFLGFYFFFMSFLFLFLMLFPAVYRSLFKIRGKKLQLLGWMVVCHTLNFAGLIITWFVLRDGPGYSDTNATAYDREYTNAAALSSYFFPPLWFGNFAAGIIAAFMMDAYRPDTHKDMYIWGIVADACTLVFVIVSAVYMFDDRSSLRPAEANDPNDTAVVNRYWSAISGRMTAPLTTLWLVALSLGHGLTARLCRTRFLVEWLAPASYGCFLFHQVIGQWYFLATRGVWWYWWGNRKSFYWFSPKPLPVEWYEHFLLVLLTVAFASFVTTHIMPFLGRALNVLRSIFVKSEDFDDETPTDVVVIEIVSKMAGVQPLLSWSIEECGMASIGAPVLVEKLHSKYPVITLTVRSLLEVETLQELVDLVQTQRDHDNKHHV